MHTLPILVGSIAAIILVCGAPPGSSFGQTQSNFRAAKVNGLAASRSLPPINERFTLNSKEVPSFQRHISPLLGRLGCNSRNCHGSFQGRGGFRLSLFGYDFKADFEALNGGLPSRLNRYRPDESLLIAKPTSPDDHGGGLRFERGSWQYHVFRRWLESGAKYEYEFQRIARLEVTPSEILFDRELATTQMKAVAWWPDGTNEDVTPLCRFQVNDGQIATVDENGEVTSRGFGDTHVVVFYDSAVVAVPLLRASQAAETTSDALAGRTKVDKLILAKLKKLGVEPSPICSDWEFLRRVSLDLAGTLPTAQEADAFAADISPTKRTAKVDALLESNAYAAWWTTKFCDWTGNGERQVAQFGDSTQPSKEWYDWIFKRIKQNTPYDELVANIVLASSRRPGQSYRDYSAEQSARYGPLKADAFEDQEQMPYFWARQNLRESEDKAIAFAYAFMGLRIQCAQCHKHPFDQWSKDDFASFENFFKRIAVSNQGFGDAQDEYRQLMQELGLEDLKDNEARRQLPALLKAGKVVPFPEIGIMPPPSRSRRTRSAFPPLIAQVPGQQPIYVERALDPRLPLMEWLKSPENPYFARAIVNRIWANYFNIGIVEPTDNLSPANPPSNGPLLDYLTSEFISHRFDLKWLHREIILSDAYQRSWRPTATNLNDERNFSRSVPRRLPAEVVYDAIRSATSGDGIAGEMLQDVPRRAIGSNGTDQKGRAAFGLQVFGRSTRSTNCDCDRSDDSSLLQTVYLRNDTAVLTAISGVEGSWVKQVAQSLPTGEKAGPSADEVDDLIRQAYLRTLTRPPSSAEAQRSRRFIEESKSPIEGLKGLLWALINTKEFVVNH